MTKKDKAKQKAKTEKQKRAEMMQDEAAKDINERFRNGTLWDKKTPKTRK